jgi:HK97 family phage portal protein
MGLLAQRWEQRSTLQDFLSDDDPYTMPTSSGVRVNSRVALSLSTVWRCVDLLASAVSQSPWDIFLKVGGRSFEQYTKPGWMSMPDPSNETYTLSDYFSQVCVSLLIAGNYFVWVIGTVFYPQALLVLDPSRVVVKPGPVYQVLDVNGNVVATLGPRDILHGTWIRLPGMLRGISPLESLRRGIGSAVATDEFASRYFGQGAALSFGVEVPGTLTPTQKAELNEGLKRKHAGLSNSHAIGVLTNGGKFVTGLAPTPEQSQMLDTRKWSVEDLCRPFGIPPAMAGSQEPGAASYAATKTFDGQFRERAVLPLAARIESQHNRLLVNEVPDGLPDGAVMQIRANLDAIARTDIKDRFAAYQLGVGSGFLTPNDARSKEDLPPLPGGDQLYMQSQMEPIDQPPTQEAAA